MDGVGVPGMRNLGLSLVGCLPRARCRSLAASTRMSGTGIVGAGSVVTLRDMEGRHSTLSGGGVLSGDTVGWCVCQS